MLYYCKPEAPRCTELSLAQAGLEPVTYCLIGRCSTTVSRKHPAVQSSHLLSGTRTRDILLDRQMLYYCKPEAPRCTELSLAQAGLEPVTYCDGICSTTVSRRHPADRALTCSGGTRTRAYCLIGRCSTSSKPEAPRCTELSLSGGTRTRAYCLIEQMLYYCKPEAPRCTELSLAQAGLEPVTYCLIGRCSLL